MNQYDPSKGAPQDQRRAGYGTYDQSQNLQKSQSPQQQAEQGDANPSLAPSQTNEDSVANPSNKTGVDADASATTSDKANADAIKTDADKVKDAAVEK